MGVQKTSEGRVITGHARDDRPKATTTSRGLMVKTLQIIRLKPNPVGKDRSGNGATATQLGGEWIDTRNTGHAAADRAGVAVYHRAYGPASPQGRWERVTSLAGRLDPGRMLRIHAGRFRDLSVLRPEDRAGADLHTFTGEDAYVWNNRERDAALLWLIASSVEVDQAAYDRDPPEGVVLVRVGSGLLPARR